MKSNISFKSNIYPTRDKWVVYDQQYLGEILNLEKMYQIKHKYPLLDIPFGLSSTQRDRFFSLKNNPKIGIIAKDDGYVLIDNDNIPDENYIKYDPAEYDYRPESYVTYSDSIHDSIDEYKTEQEEIDNNITLQTAKTIEIKTENLLATVLKHDDNIKSFIVNNEIEEDISAAEETNNRIIETTSVKQATNIFEKFSETEQKDIIEADSDNVIFVDAGPGTGKTYTLIQRIQYLVEKCNVPADEIQVLCFTNSAVNEIKERLNKFIKGDGDRSLANVDVRTFHSFAWWLIGEANERKWNNVAMHNLDYDRSIRIASKIMSNRVYYSQVIKNWKHFIVDEIQDLTNHLARFVLYMVNACLENKTGITVLGDSCQAIYDYTLKEEKNIPMSSQDFYNALVRRTEETGLYMSMTKNHRQTGDFAGFASKYRKAILSQDIPKIQDEVVAISENLVENGYLSKDFEKEIEKIRNGKANTKICFVCRNNGQTLNLSSEFRKKMIGHTLNANTSEKNYAAWVSEFFYGFTKSHFTHTEFIDRYNSLVNGKSSVDPEEIWREIVFRTKSDGAVNTSDFLRKVGRSKIDNPYFRYTDKNDILVSTIHKTKGHEYDSVVIDQSFVKDLIEKRQEIGEYKTLYVSVTRPKKSLYSAQLSGSRNNDPYKIKIFKTKRERFGRMKVNRVSSFELISGLDINIESFLDDKIQAYLSNISIGDPIKLKRTCEDGQIIYNIVHELEDRATIIGKLHDTFREDLSARMEIPESDYIRLPDTITYLYVSGKYTFIATEDYLKAHPEIAKLSPNGVWQWVEFVGIGHASYDIY